MTLSVTGCSPVQTVEYCEPVIIEKDRIVHVPEYMTTPVEIIDISENFDVYELGAAYSQQRTRTIQCNGQLAEIAGLTE
jgi:hypothetical protein